MSEEKKRTKSEKKEEKEELKFVECISIFDDEDHFREFEPIVISWIQYNENEDEIKHIIHYCNNNQRAFENCQIILPTSPTKLISLRGEKKPR
jgi:hypothetical protein